MDHTKIAAAVLALGAAAGTSASPITISQTIILGQLLNGTSTTVQFDLNATLASQGLNASNVQSGHLVVYGISDASYGAGAAQPYGGYELQSSNTYVAYYQYAGGNYFVCTSYSWWSGNCMSGYYVPAYYSPVYRTDRTYLRSGDILYTDSIADNMVVTAGTSSASDLADQLSSSLATYGAWNYEASNWNGNGYDRTYDRARNSYQALSGPLTVDLGLDLVALADFGADGILSSFITASLGQFTVNSAMLTLQVDDAPPTGVPEPDSLLLAGTALALATLVARRRRRKAK
jgi:MYXO-CTERM domain-containing protein